MKLFRRKKNAYFRKIDKNNRLIIVVKDATREELVYISNLLQNGKDFDYLVCVMTDINLLKSHMMSK